MKTAEEKTNEFLDKTDLWSRLTNSGYVDIKKILIELLKEQDRDTRHACAEAVLKCGYVMNHKVILMPL